MINSVQVGNYIYPLVEGQPLIIKAGETIKVSYSFKYKAPSITSAKIWASLFYYTLLGMFEHEERAQTKETITLEASPSVWKDYSGEINIIVQSNCTPDTYGLILELPDYKDAVDKREDCIEVTGVPNFLSSIGSLIVLGIMMGLISQITPKEEV